MKRIASALALALTFASLGACRTNFTETWQLTDFRVLGIKSDPPEAPRDTDVHVTLAYADVRMRAVQVVWLACAAPISLTQGLDGGTSDAGSMQSFGGASGCHLVTVPGTPIPDLGTSVTVHIPATGGAPDIAGHEAVSIVGFACAGGTIGLPMEGGVQPTCNENGNGPALGWQFTGEILVRPQNPINPPNHNPTISEVRFGMMGMEQPITMDAPPTVPRCTDTSMDSHCPHWSFTVGYTPDSRESYLYVSPLDGGTETRHEFMTTGFVIEQGRLSGAFRTDSSVMPMATMQNDWTAPATAGDVHLFLYAIDQRGGFDWTERVVRVQ